MFNWLFKKVVTFREKVAVDLGTGDVEKPFLDHLDDLRQMIVRMVTSMLIVTVGTFLFHKELLKILFGPISFAGLQDKIVIQSFEVIGPFMTAMNVSLVAALILSFPLLLYFLLQFVLPGLKTTEKKVLFPAMLVGAGLFLTGVIFAYYVVTPRALEFFYDFGTSLIAETTLPGSGDGPKAPPAYIWELTKYVKFICQFVLIFGLCFELPVVVMALVKLDVLNYKVMKGSRSLAAIMICVIAAVITPTQDALTLGLLAVPMYVLYEICIWLAYFMEKRDRQLYPEYYKDIDEDNKSIEVSDDWDNENYNPWNDGNGDDEEEAASTQTPVTPATGSAAVSGAAVATSAPVSLVKDADTGPIKPVSAPTPDPDPDPDAAPDAAPDEEPSADKRDTD
jgi:sec-independent protein translocase protein TatC